MKIKRARNHKYDANEKIARIKFRGWYNIYVIIIKISVQNVYEQLYGNTDKNIQT